MKVTIKLYVSDGASNNEMFPVKIVVTHKGKTIRETISHSGVNDWDQVNQLPLITHLDYDNLYPEILTYRARAFDRSVRDSEDVSFALKFVQNSTTVKRIDFYDFANVRIVYMIAQNRAGNAAAYKAAIAQLQTYAPALFVDEITTSFLEGFKEFKKMQVKTLKDGSLRKVKNSTVRNYLYEIRAIYNACVKRYELHDKRPFMGLFADLHVSKRRVKNAYLDKETLRILQEVKGLPTGQQRAVDLSLLQFYLGGADFIDIHHLKWSQIVANRVYLKRAKLGEKAEEFDVRIFDGAWDIINKYKTTGVYVFPWSKDRVKYATFRRTHTRSLQAVCKKLKIETKPKPEVIATKTIRHSFATIAKFMFIDIDVIRELMGHERDDIDTVYKDKYPQEVRDDAHLKIIS